ncbi:bifunctional PIG-L family deacetylase/class I SAM-dependent methyltransferase [Brevibacterium album]|uniref:bifunctional PIG-L family deacetylase/class I SAM-dependent methyltransferase n=1 Tax=Brevibacterium album TaxID=417948 RepID=UPI000414D917|nr:bifunctional PIG-L family deacetylase/class I SAM-dependent methyltransferase [Brevibacterium album]
MTAQRGAAPGAQREDAFSHADAGTPEAVWQEQAALASAGALDLSGIGRLIVVAAHPDDETLMAGGLLATAAGRGLRTEVVIASGGEASHPHSPTHTPARLAGLRRHEVAEAVRVLAPGAGLHLLDLGDGRLGERGEELTAALVRLVGAGGADTLLVSTWRGDRHPDHAAVAEASASAAWRTDAQHLEAPLWLWHWGSPEDLAGLAGRSPLVRLDLSPEARERKRRAVALHTSQTAQLSPAPGDEALLSREVLEHFERAFEIFCRPERGEESPFEPLHRSSADPWGARTRWYEARKRALTLAALPAQGYGTAFELGCSTGMLAQELAARCERVLAIDESASALARAQAVVTDPRVELRRLRLPEEWPEEAPGLVVVSEIGYFLSPRRMLRLAERIAGSGAGTVVACHWRHPLVGWPLSASEVHGLLDRRLPFSRVLTAADADFELVVWSRESPADPVSSGRGPHAGTASAAASGGDVRSGTASGGRILHTGGRSGEARR